MAKFILEAKRTASGEIRVAKFVLQGQKGFMSGEIHLSRVKRTARFEESIREPTDVSLHDAG